VYVATNIANKILIQRMLLQTPEQFSIKFFNLKQTCTFVL